MYKVYGITWLKAAAARFRCRPGRIVAATRLQLVKYSTGLKVVSLDLILISDRVLRSDRILELECIVMWDYILR